MALSMGQLIDQLLHVRPKEGPLLVLFSKLAFAHERSKSSQVKSSQVKSSQVKSSQVKSSQVLFSKLAFAHERSRHQCGKSVVTDTRGAGHSLGRAPLTEVHQKTRCTEAAVVKFTLDYEFVPRMLSCDALRRLEPAEHASATPIERV